MIRENQQLLNRVNVLSDGVLSYLMLPLAYYLRFYVMKDGIQTVPLADYLRLGIAFVVIQIFSFAAFGLYQLSRKTRIRDELKNDRELGYQVIGYIARHTARGFDVPYLGGYEVLGKVLSRTEPDEVVSAIDTADYVETPHIIHACEQAGVKLAIVPFYADYMPAHPQFDDLNGIPLMNIRRIPLDNFANAFLKRAIDIFGSAFLLALLSPVMLLCAIGVKISSPGPVVFKQKRVGKNKKPFYMYKFRSMRVNKEQDSAWSARSDNRRTGVGALLRKYSLDELPQFWNVLRGDMSLVGPRPEIPHFVDQFKDDVPLYMVRHQVRPGITGWAQINGLRGDTSIKKRIEYDIHYIEDWSIWLDIQILMITVFRGKFINDEQLGVGLVEAEALNDSVNV